MNRAGVLFLQPISSPCSPLLRAVWIGAVLAIAIGLGGCAREEPIATVGPNLPSPDRTTREGLIAVFAGAHERGDLTAYAECLHPEFTFDLSGEAIPESWSLCALDRDADLEITRCLFDSLDVRLVFPEDGVESESRSWTEFSAKTSGSSALHGLWSTFTVDVGWFGVDEAIDHWVTGEADIYCVPDPENADLWVLWKIRDRTDAWTRLKTAFGPPAVDVPDSSGEDPSGGSGGDAPADTTDNPGEDPEVPGDDGAIHELYRSSLPRDLSPDPSGVDELVHGNHEFAFDLYGQFRTEPGNFLFSPLSIRTAFAMVYAGARGETAEQMAQVLHYDGGDGVHTAFNALDQILRRRNRPADGFFSEIELSVANDFWGRIGLPFETDYLDLLSVHYGSGIHGLNFETAPEESRLFINEWVAERTHDRILDLLPSGAVSPITAAVLTNTLYFKAPWAGELEDIGPGIFHLLDGSTTTAAMMAGDARGGFVEGDGYTAAEIGYREYELGMIIVVPRAGTFAAFESELTVDLFERIAQDLLSYGGEVHVTMPMFTFESQFRLSRVLQSLGMVLPFMNCFPVPCADFSGITNPGVMNLYISEAFHKTFIAVDEKGTEAAAATAIVMDPTTGYHPRPPSFVADRPFIFAIRDIETGAILFLGRVLNPTAP